MINDGVYSFYLNITVETFAVITKVHVTMNVLENKSDKSYQKQL